MKEKLQANYDAIANLVEETRNDFDKFMNGNKSAGTRVRKAMMELKKLAQAVREGVQEIKNSEQ